MTTPGQPSGTYAYNPSNAQIVLDAFDRIQMRPAMLDRHHFISARQSLNDLFVEWSNSSINLWEIISGTITLLNPVAGVGQATYALPTTLIFLTDMWFTTINGNGTGLNSDRWMEPITRTQYAMLPNKLQPGQPTQYWYQLLVDPQVIVYQAPQAGTPNYEINWFGLQQVQDANSASGETPNIPYRAIDAMKAGLALRLAEKFKPEQWTVKKAIYDIAWGAFVGRNDEPGPLIVQPNISAYSRMM